MEGFILSVMVAIMAPMGDLFESFVKRACDIKDSGNILPGHGGMMDRFDSLLFVAPSLVAVLALLSGSVWLAGRSGDWAWQRPELAPGGWAFQYRNDHYPDVDDTAVVAMALWQLWPVLGQWSQASA